MVKSDQVHLLRGREAGLAYQKYHDGDVITDDELVAGIEVFGAIADLAIEVGPVFLLTAIEARRVSEAFKDFQRYRKKNQ